MHRIDAAGFAAGNLFTDGNPATGTSATVVDAAFLNDVQENLVGPITDAGIALVKGDYTQLSAAIKTLIRMAAGAYAADTGAVNALAVALTPAATAYTAGMLVRAKVAVTNTGAATIAVNGLAAKAIVHGDGSALQVGDLTAGQVVDLRYDGANFQLVPETGRLINVRVITASGTYTPTPGMKNAIVEGVGGGGGSGSAAANAAGSYSVTGGGGAGAYGKSRFTAAQIDASQTVTIGAAGSAGGIGAAGGNGGTTSFGALMSVPGGLGSVASGTSNAIFAAAGASGGGDASGANIIGSRGANGANGIAQGVGVIPGEGGLSMLGLKYGGGAPGVGTGSGSAAAPGNVGQPGILIVMEYA